ncbi:hypothetical protein AB1Y20_019615 [Prymnesium parvum]|uniref:Protein-serine/threonine kinase n=1 Tax=Prymnesium parvum TaxID=97485 RepID=A0AB34JV39_PRYPA
MPAEVPSVSVEELRASTEGGASRYKFGEMGTSGHEMQPFWVKMGLPLEVCTLLSLNADRLGGVWGDPPTLSARCDALRVLLPLRPLRQIIAGYPSILAYRPDTVREKLQILSDALPRTDVLLLVSNSPAVLSKAPEKLRERIECILGLFPRRDLPQLVAEHPKLLRVPAAELEARGAALAAAFSTRTLFAMKRARLARLLSYGSDKLARLQYMDRCYPGMRDRHISDFYLLRMPIVTFERMFDRKQPPRRASLRAVLNKVNPRMLRPLRAALPARVNAFQWGRQAVGETCELTRVQRQREAPAREAMEAAHLARLTALQQPTTPGRKRSVRAKKMWARF